MVDVVGMDGGCGWWNVISIHIGASPYARVLAPYRGGL